MKKNSFFLVACLIMMPVFIGGCSGPQSKAVSTTSKYPEKPITLIVPFSVGGGQDLLARVMEKQTQKYLGQPLVIVNKPGSAGALGWNELTGASPDGYTIGTTATEVLVLPLYGMAKYDYSTAMLPLAQIATASWAIAVKAEQPWQNIDDLVAYAKQHPGQLKFSHAGVGSLPHIIGETIGREAAVKLSQVPFRSAGEAAAALLGGHVQIAIVTPSVIKEHVKNGTVKVLAVSGDKRSSDPDFASVPTLKEQGFNIAYENWYGLAAPKDMQPEVTARLAEGLKAMTEDKEFKQTVENMGLQVEYLGPQETANKWIKEKEKISKIIAETGILDLIKNQKK